MNLLTSPGGGALLFFLGILVVLLLAPSLVGKRLVRKLRVRHGAPPRPLQRLLRIPVLGPLLHSLLPKELAGESLPPVVRLFRFGRALGLLLLFLLPVAFAGFAAYRFHTAPRDPVTGRLQVRVDLLEMFTNPVILFATWALPAFLFCIHDWRRRMDRPARELGIALDRRALKGVSLGLLVGAMLVSLNLLLGLAGGIRYHRVQPGDGPPPLAPVLTFVLVALYEEMIFRGYVLQALRMQYRPVTAVVASSLLFALFHLQYLTLGWFSILAVVSLFSFAAILAIGRIVTGSLALPVAIHFVWNTAGWAFGHAGGLLKLESPWLQADWGSASTILVGTPTTAGILEAVLSLLLLSMGWIAFRGHPSMASGPGRSKNVV